MIRFCTLCILLLVLFYSTPGFTQIPTIETQLVITQPIENQIIQRDLTGKATIYITGYYNSPLEYIEVRLIPEGSTPASIGWQSFSNSGFEGTFSGHLIATTGWYALEMRGITTDNQTVSKRVEHVGIGEIFIIGGASNSMGMPKHGAKGASKNVMSFNKVNKYLNQEEVTIVKDQPYDHPTFSQYESENFAYPTGESAWLWGELGDKIAAKTGAPVLLFNVGWAAANSADYRTNIEGKDAFNFYVGKYWPHRQPYSNVLNTLRYFPSWLGARSFLWAHGETDAEYTDHTQRQYVNNIKLLIQESRLSSGQNLHWTIAVGGASLGSITPQHPITHAQVELGTTKGLNTSLGPITDTIQVPRFNGHFANIQGGVQGLSLAAEAWNRVLTNNYFNTVQPVLSKGTIHIGVTPSKSSPSASFPIPYKIEGTIAQDSQVQAELMTEDGRYVAIIGEGKSSPLWIQLPQEIASNSYRIRLTATKPTYLPGSISEPIIIDSTLSETQFLRHFRLQKQSNHLTIQWLHTAHPSLQQQILQKSNNSFDYIDIAQFEAAENKKTSQFYMHEDTNVTAGISYYRIKSVLENEVVYSQAIPHFTGELPTDFTVFPNPIQRDHFLVMTSNNQKYHYSIFDINGAYQPALVNTNAVEGMVTILLPPSMTNGIYLLKIQGQEHTITKRIYLRR